MLLAPPSDQQELAYHLVRSGACMFLGGLLYGLTVYSSKYPRLALYVHIEGVTIGGSMITLGLLTKQIEFVGTLTPWEVYIIWATQVVSWPMWFSQIAQSFWGTNKMNSIVAPSSSFELANCWLLLPRRRLDRMHGKRI